MNNKIDTDLLKLNTKEIGSAIKIFDTLESTNLKAKELAQASCKSGTVVIAEKQTAGKGRLGRSWYSPSRTGLWVSIVVRPGIAPIKSPFLTIVAALAVSEVLQKLEKKLAENSNSSLVEIKWPNDILIKSEKVAGILAEMSANLNRIKYAVVGIGINVNQEDFPEEIRQVATSLKIKYKQHIDRTKLLQNLLVSFERYYYLLLNKKDKELLDLWRKKLNIIGERVTIYNNEKVIQGNVLDISEKGELILKEIGGGTKRFWAGDVTLRKQ